MNRMGTVYGEGLYTLAKEEGLDEAVLQQLKVLSECFDAQPDYLKLLSSHDLPKAERVGILDGDFRGKVHKYVLNFLKILTEKGYIRHFSDCYKAYADRYCTDRGILQVKAIAAIDLTEAQQDKLKATLTRITGKTVELSCRVDKSVLGGVRLQYGGCQVDGTLQNRLAEMEKQLKNTVI